MSSYHDHQILVTKILCELSKNKNIRVWANSTGVAKSLDDERFIKYGLNGSADIIGIAFRQDKNIGQFLAIEVKTGKATQSAAQKNFEKMIKDRGGVYILARSVLDALKGVEAAHTVTLDVKA
jgi:hypothetical protein